MNKFLIILSSTFAEETAQPALTDGFYVGASGGYSYTRVKYDQNRDGLTNPTGTRTYKMHK